MAETTLDRLLTTLDVQLHAFAICEVEAGSRLVFDPMKVVVAHYVLRGEGSLEIEGMHPRAFARGSILIVPPCLGQALVAGTPSIRDVPAADNCAMVADGLVKFDAADGQAGDLSTICATLTATYAGSFGLFDRLAGPIVADMTDVPAVRAAFAMLAEEGGSPDIGTHAITGALMKQCLILLIRRQLREDSLSSPFFASLADTRLLNAVALVLQSPGGPLTLPKLAAAAGMSRTAFTNAFANTFGQTPMDFVQKTRLHHAAQLLTATQLPVKAVAASIGFASRSHFSRAFRRAYQADPSAYRRRHTGDTVDARRTLAAGGAADRRKALTHAPDRTATWAPI